MFAQHKEINNDILKRMPFSLFCGKDILPMEDIYKTSNEFKNDLDKFEISKKVYSIKFKKITEQNCEMTLFLGNEIEHNCVLFNKPIILALDTLNLSVKKIYIFSYEQIHLIISNYKNEYNFFDYNNNILDENQRQKSLEYISVVKKREYNLEDKRFLEAIENFRNFKEKMKSKDEQKCIEIEPLLLSFNIYEIFPELLLLKKKFELILNEERKKFLLEINDFLSSEKKFLWIIGTDGIGKTVSLMFYSIISEKNVIYFNLKLFHKNCHKIKELFANEIIKFFYFKKYNQTGIKIIQNKLLYLFDEIFNNNNSQKRSNSKPIEDIWFYLNLFICKFQLTIANVPLVIILDQYRDISSDDNYSNINDFIRAIYEKGHKVIILTSINNYNIHSAFASNINYYSFKSNDKEHENDDYDLSDLNEDEYDVKQECEFYEKLLKKKNCKKEISEKNKLIFETITIKSDLLLNTSYTDDTLKIYISDLVSGKDLVSNDFLNEEKKCFINFNYNIKYINKYLIFKHDYMKKIKENIKNNFIIISNKDFTAQIENNEQTEINNEITTTNNNNDIITNNNNSKIKENIISKIIKEFYDSYSDHIIKKIDNFYTNKDYKSDSENCTINEYIKLRELRDIIFNKDFLSLYEIRNKIINYPGKYLNIRRNEIEGLALQNNSHIPNFQIEYTNTFFKFTINKLLKDMEKEMGLPNSSTKGCGAGINFEKKIIETILTGPNYIFGEKNYHKRIVFSLIGKTKNSEKTIQKHRIRENNNQLYDFYDIKEYSEIIDDIDFEKGSGKIKLSEDLYLIVQASKTGRSFDFAILKRDRKTNEWFLYIFQATINKYEELKTLKNYIIDSFLCESYLDDLYDIKIKRKYFIFVIPNICENSFIEELENRNIYYIFYKNNQFYNKENNIINSLNFQKAEIKGHNIKKEDYYLEQIEKSLKSWNESVDKYLNKKRKTDKLADLYTNSLSIIKGRGIKLKLSVEMKNKIIDAIFKKKTVNFQEYELLFIGNCKLNNIDKVYENNNNLVIFFKINKNYYFYYNSFYQYINDSFNEIKKKPTIKKRIKNFDYEKNPINLSDIKENYDLCFCYQILC